MDRPVRVYVRMGNGEAGCEAPANEHGRGVSVPRSRSASVYSLGSQGLVHITGNEQQFVQVNKRTSKNDSLR